MRKILSNVSLSVINFTFKAYQGLKDLCDPACEGNPYTSVTPSMSGDQVKKNVFSFKFRRMSWR